MFYVMSGFLMYYTYENKSFEHSLKDNLKFSLSKIKKLYPLHIITMIFAIILSIAVMVNKGITIRNIVGLLFKTILNVTLLQTWFPKSDINVSLNGVAWYLSVTMFLYFMFPTLMLVIKKLKEKKLIMISILMLILEVLLCIPFIAILGEESHIYIWFMYCFPIFRLGDFWIGMSLSKVFLNRPISVDASTTVIEVFMTLLTVAVFLLLKLDYSNIIVAAIHNWTTVYIPIATAWVYLFAIKKGGLTRILSNKYLIYLGNISSYLFLIHYVITQYTNRFLGFCNLDFKGISKAILVSVELLLSIILSVLYKKCVSNRKPYILF